MRLGALLSWFPSILEAKDDNYFEPVILQKPCEVKCKDIAQDAPDNLTEPPSAISPEFNKLLKKHHTYAEKKLNKKYQYLSSHMVETNEHVLGIYKRIKSLEENYFKTIKAEVEKLSGRMDYLESSIEPSVINSDNCSGQLNTQTDIVYLYHKLEKMSEKLSQLEDKVKDKKEVSRSYVPIMSQQQNGKAPNICLNDLLPSSNGSNTAVTLQSNLMKFMLPSVVTVTAVVINMYMYMTSARKFPM